MTKKRNNYRGELKLCPDCWEANKNKAGNVAYVPRFRNGEVGEIVDELVKTLVNKYGCKPNTVRKGIKKYV